MSSFHKIFKFAVIALASGIMTASDAAPTTESCLIPEAGNYAFESVAMTGELVGVGQGFVPVLEKAPPMGNLGVWTLTNVDQGGFQITNVELARNVVTTHLVESNLFVPQLADLGQSGSTYAIECAGANPPVYVIKAVDADQLWTTIPGTGESDIEAGVAFIQILPASGSNEQRFILHPL